MILEHHDQPPSLLRCILDVLSSLDRTHGNAMQRREGSLTSLFLAFEGQDALRPHGIIRLDAKFGIDLHWVCHILKHFSERQNDGATLLRGEDDDSECGNVGVHAQPIEHVEHPILGLDALSERSS